MAPDPLSVADALFLDFDGVLSDLVDNPDDARLSEVQSNRLVALGRAFDGALCILSGRALDDLSARVPGALWRVGAHGLQVAEPGAPAPPRPESPPDLAAALAGVLADFPGTRLEAKGAVLAVHYRQAPELGRPLGAALEPVVARHDGYRLHGGKLVFEAKPEGSNKGVALRRMMQAAPFAGRRPVMVGDDVTDEDGFAAASDLGGYGVKVGPGETAADYRLPDVDAVWDWLREAA